MTTRATLLTAIRGYLSSDYGDASQDPLSRLSVAFDDAVNDLWKAFNWSFIFGTATINTTAGNLGGYALPADYDSQEVPERVDLYGYEPLYSVKETLTDSNGNKVDVTIDRTTYTLHFFKDPNNSQYTLNYRKLPPSSEAEIDGVLPDYVWINKFLRNRTAYYFTFSTPDWAKDAERFFQISEITLRNEIENIRKGQSRQRVRNPLNSYGNPVYTNFIRG